MDGGDDGRRISLEEKDVAPVHMAGDEQDILAPPAGSDEALAAVHRLATVFADLAIPDLDQTLADPLLTLEHVDVSLAAGYS